MKSARANCSEKIWPKNFDKIHMKDPVMASMESPFLALLPNFYLFFLFFFGGGTGH